jgi:hypothetical protein
MGKAAKLRQQRRLQRLIQEARRLEAQESKPPCESCAFKDPEAWIADLRMKEKLTQCLQDPRHRFYCHEGLPVDEDNRYQPPTRADGRPDASQMPLCGGFLRWALAVREKPPKEQERILSALQQHFVSRFLTTDLPLAQEWREQGFSPFVVATAINMTGRAPCVIQEDRW